MLEVKKHKDVYEVNVFHSNTSKSHYHNIIDKDPHKLAQIFIDLFFEGFPIVSAFKIMQKRIKNKDWLGF